METIAIGIGGNVGDPVASVRQAIARIESMFEWTDFQSSSLYRTTPVGPVAQESFVNAVCMGKSGLAPLEMLRMLQQIEREMGRVRDVRWGPRTIDLDILWVGEQVVNLPSLKLPHPEMHKRGFVLVPLAELMPQWCHPVEGKTVDRLLEDWRQAGGSSDEVSLLDRESIPS